MKNRLSIASMLICALMAWLTSGLTHATDIQAPFPIQKLQADFSKSSSWKDVPIISDSSEGFKGETQFQYDDSALYLRTIVSNSETVFAPDDAFTNNSCRLYEYDSMEFWLGRHQLIVGIVSDRGAAFDCTAGQAVEKAELSAKRTSDGYEIIARIPWKSLDLQPEKRKYLPLSVWFNKVRHSNGTAQRIQSKIPTTAEWDRPATYGAAFLNDNIPLKKCAATLAPLSVPTVETAAFISQDRLILQSSPAYGALNFRCVVGSRFDQIIRSSSPPTLVALPAASAPEIARVDLYAQFPEGNSFGPISIEYFSHGTKPLGEYRSLHEPPDDFDAFWDARLAELAREPMEAVKRIVDQPNPAADLWEVTLRSWRGAKIVAYISVPKAPGKYPLSLWVYPASATEAKDMQMSDHEVILCVNSRGFGPSQIYSPKPDQIYVSNAKTPDDFYPLANILDIIRGIDFAATLEQVDPSRIFVAGGSRGGYLTMALAANDPRIAVATASVPCYADVDMMGRLGFSSAASDAFLAWDGGTPERRNAMRSIWPYFDTVNLAHRIRCPIVVEAGMTDSICAAPGIVDAFNRIASKKKFLLINPERGHTGTMPGGAISALLKAEAGRPGRTP